MKETVGEAPLSPEPQARQEESCLVINWDTDEDQPNPEIDLMNWNGDPEVLSALLGGVSYPAARDEEKEHPLPQPTQKWGTRVSSAQKGGAPASSTQKGDPERPQPKKPHQSPATG
ncbi:UNVERIFIED_CONTAM: hypothetical protein FKN15_035477 [Acipenser sinensis]